MNTTTIPVSELSGAALDWAVAKCEGFNVEEVPARIEELVNHWESMAPPPIPHESIRPYWVDFWRGCCIGPSGGAMRIPGFSSDWSLAGPLIERERVGLFFDRARRNRWRASHRDIFADFLHESPLVAAMRCYVASKLGDTVDVPSELL